MHEYFLGLIGVQEFFSFNFPLREFFFLYFARPPPSPIRFLMVRPLRLKTQLKVTYKKITTERLREEYTILLLTHYSLQIKFALLVLEI